MPVRVDEDLLTGAAGVKRRRPERGVPVREGEGDVLRLEVSVNHPERVVQVVQREGYLRDVQAGDVLLEVADVAQQRVEVAAWSRGRTDRTREARIRREWASLRR